MPLANLAVIHRAEADGGVALMLEHQHSDEENAHQRQWPKAGDS